MALYGGALLVFSGSTSAQQHHTWSASLMPLGVVASGSQPIPSSADPPSFPAEDISPCPPSQLGSKVALSSGPRAPTAINL
ncbi:hypothetical protein NPIL_100731 [Nephila pilipes]|uniref:Uncharacterized protein n=1 Tax=Nephila pilipes TaxID=299642 RepID=A0A8X6Q201_NEPPI|nr:hypothetical protein NPIL_100731 [Nephila pilipes]